MVRPKFLFSSDSSSDHYVSRNLHGDGYRHKWMYRLSNYSSDPRWHSSNTKYFRNSKSNLCGKHCN